MPEGDVVPAAAPCIWVLAGTNGAGKSSLMGAVFSRHGVPYFNPDEAARRIREANPQLSPDDANAAAWNEGRRLLERAIAERKTLAFETTLGGKTITGLLRQAAAAGLEVRIWYAGLDSPELHLRRVQSRVRHGGHDIPEALVRYRFDSARTNLIDLLPSLTELRLFDNSEEDDPHEGLPPKPRLLLHWREGAIVAPPDLSATPGWAKPIVATALKLTAKPASHYK